MTETAYKNSELRPKASSKDYIWTQKNSLDKSFCKSVIEKFDAEKDKYIGRVGTDGRIDIGVKQTKDYVLTRSDCWKDEDVVFYKALKEGLMDYHTYLHDIHPHCRPPANYKTKDTGYKIQRYEPGGFYDWHNDWCMSSSGSRIYVFMWYLNTIKRKDGGHTEFGDGTKLQPQCGTLVIFPATWTYLHRGFPPKVRKYICNGWIFSKP